MFVGKFFDVLVEEFVKRLHQVKSPQTRNDYSNLTKSDWNGLKQSQNYCGESLNIAYLIQAFSDQLGIGVHEDNTLPKNKLVVLYVHISKLLCNERNSYVLF